MQTSTVQTNLQNPSLTSEIEAQRVTLSFAQKTFEQIAFKVYDEQMANIKNHLWILSLIISGAIGLYCQFVLIPSGIWTKSFFLLFITVSITSSVFGIYKAIEAIKVEKITYPVTKFANDFDYLNSVKGEYSALKELGLLKDWLKDIDNTIQTALKMNEERARVLKLINNSIFVALGFLILALIPFGISTF
nr:MAG TPA: hypothetical protein [Caudoviricetes sp.]